MTATHRSGTTKIILSVLFLTLSFHLFAGDQYREGYIITLKGDTLHGYLLYRTNMYASKSCRFKEKLDDAYTEYFPGDIAGYRFQADKYYVTKELVQDSVTVKPVFMEYLINGKADIFYYVDSDGEHYYIEKEGFGLIQLTEQRRTNLEGERYVPPKYKGKLTCVMDDCPQIAPEISRSSLSHQSLIKLAKDYNEMVCSTDSCVIYERTGLKVKLGWEVLAGVGLNNYIFGTEIQTNYANVYQLGLGLELNNLIPSNERIRLQISFLFGKSSTYKISQTPDSYFTTQVTYQDINYNISSQNAYNSVSSLAVDLDVMDLTIPIIVNYKLPVKKTSFIAGIGLTNKFVLSQSDEFVYSVFNDEYGKLINTYLVGGVANFGVERHLSHNQMIGIRFEYQSLFHPTSLNDITRLKENQFMIQLNYGFGSRKK